MCRFRSNVVFRFVENRKLSKLLPLNQKHTGIGGVALHGEGCVLPARIRRNRLRCGGVGDGIQLSWGVLQDRLSSSSNSGRSNGSAAELHRAQLPALEFGS